MSSRILPEFEMLIPASMEEALSSLSENAGNVSILAGGTDLLVNMKGGMSCTPEGFDTHYVLSLSDIPGLDTIEYDEKQGLTIGAMATLTQALDTPVIKEKYKALWEAISVCGTVQTRNMGTVVGNLMNASPCADCSCAILATGGIVVLQGPSGIREVDIDSFWLGYRMTAIQNDEIAIAVKLPVLPDNAFTTHIKMTRVEHDLAKLSTSVRVDMDSGNCKDVRIAMGSIAPIMVRVKESEKLLAGQKITDDLLEKVAKSVSKEIQPIDDVRSTAEYRRHVGGIIVKRAIAQAIAD